MMWLVDTRCVFRLSWEPDGTATDVGTVTVTITRGDGTAIVTGGATVNNADGTYDYTLAAASNSQIDRLKFVWTSAGGESITTYEDIVGSLLFTETDLRAFDDQLLADASKYSDQDILDARDRVTEQFEDYCNRSFIPRYGRVKGTVTADNPYEFWLRAAIPLWAGDGYWVDPIEVFAATDAGGTVTVGNIAVGQDSLYRTDGQWRTNPTLGDPWPIVVDYSYGLPRVPGDVRLAAMTLARYELVTKDVTDRMISFSDPNVGTVRLSTPSRDFPTGIPTVDEVLNRYRMRVSV